MSLLLDQSFGDAIDDLARTSIEGQDNEIANLTLSRADIIPASLPDNVVPAEKVGTRIVTKQKTRRTRRFLKGPIPFPWIHGHICDPADRLLLMLLAHSDMQRSIELKVCTRAQTNIDRIEKTAKKTKRPAVEVEAAKVHIGKNDSVFEEITMSKLYEKSTGKTTPSSANPNAVSGLVVSAVRYEDPVGKP